MVLLFFRLGNCKLKSKSLVASTSQNNVLHKMWVELAMVQNQKMLPNFFPMWVELPMVQNQKILPNFFLVYGTRTQLKEKKKNYMITPKMKAL